MVIRCLGNGLLIIWHGLSGGPLFESPRVAERDTRPSRRHQESGHACLRGRICMMVKKLLVNLT